MAPFMNNPRMVRDPKKLNGVSTVNRTSVFHGSVERYPMFCNEKLEQNKSKNSKHCIFFFFYKNNVNMIEKMNESIDIEQNLVQ